MLLHQAQHQLLFKFSKPSLDDFGFWFERGGLSKTVGGFFDPISSEKHFCQTIQINVLALDLRVFHSAAKVRFGLFQGAQTKRNVAQVTTQIFLRRVSFKCKFKPMSGFFELSASPFQFAAFTPENWLQGFKFSH